MILQIDDWVFDIDIDQTMAYSSAEAAEHCECAYCRNFYGAVDQVYPELRPFLTQFGLDIEAPDEQMPYDMDGKMYYDSVYMVCGSITQWGSKPFRLGNVLIRPSVDVECDHLCPEPHFALEVDSVILPWILDEPMEETVSPANFPEFLKKMWERLLGKFTKNDMQS